MLNLGTVRANSLYIEGQNVTVLDTDKVTKANGTPLKGDAVTIRSENCPHIGYRVSRKINRSFYEGGVMVKHKVYDYECVCNHLYDSTHLGAEASASERKWEVLKPDGSHWLWHRTPIFPKEPGYGYMIVDDIYNLQHINDSDRMLKENYILDRDIDGSAMEVFTPIGRESYGRGGTFDGAFHTIRGLRIIRHDLPYVGVFGDVTGTIENLAVEGGRVEGYGAVGGIVGYVTGGRLKNLRNANEVRGLGVFSNPNYEGVGGIVGVAISRQIENVYNAGTVCGRKNVGGIVGHAENSIISGAANVGRVSAREADGVLSAENENVGGIVGNVENFYDLFRKYNNTQICNAYNTGHVDGWEAIGGIVGTATPRPSEKVMGITILKRVYNAGLVQGSTGRREIGSLLGDCNEKALTINHAVWKEGTSSRAIGSISTGAEYVHSLNHQMCTEAEMKQAATYANWKDDDGKAVVAAEGGKGLPWRIYEGKTMPLLTGLMQGTKYVDGRTKVYDGTAPTITGDHLYLDASKNVGTYRAYSDQLGYDLIGAYTITPKKVTVALKPGVRFDKTYDGSNETVRILRDMHYTLTGLVGSDDNMIALTPIPGTYETKDVRPDQTVTFSGLTLTNEGAENYMLDKTSLTGTGTIRQRALTPAIKPGVRFDKEYDGGKTARALTQNDCKMTGLIAGDSVALSGTGEYQNKNAGMHSVTYTGLVLTGTDAGNYKLQRSTLRGMGEIARKTLTIKPMSGTYFTKAYDGNAWVREKLALDTNYKLWGIVPGDDAALDEDSARGIYETVNAQAAGQKQDVKFDSLFLKGADKANYALAVTTKFEDAGRITPKQLAITVKSGARFDKTYDGTRDTAETLRKGRDYTLSGFIMAEGSTIEIAPVKGTYANKNAGIDKNVTFTGLKLTGKGAGNYRLSTANITGFRGTITARALTIDPVEGALFTKTYDGTRTVTEPLMRNVNYTLTGALAGDSVWMPEASVTGTYATKDVQAGARQNVTFTNLTLMGTDAANYTIAPSMEVAHAGVIKPKELTLNSMGAGFVKTYDSTTDVLQPLAKDVNYTLSGFAAGEGAGIELAQTTGRYWDKNAASYKSAIFDDVRLQGAGSGNYVLNTTQFVGSGKIDPKAITLTLRDSARFDKVYDGTDALRQTIDKSHYTLAGVYEGDDLILRTDASGRYTAGKNVGVDKAVTFGVDLAGTDAANYTMPTYALTGKGTISPRALRMEAVYPGMKCEKTYDGNDRAAETLQEYVNYRLQDRIGGDAVSLDETAAEGHYQTKNAQDVGKKQDVTFRNLALKGADKDNYTLADSWTVENAGYIARRDLTVTPMGSRRYDKVYDGSLDVKDGPPSLVKNVDYTLSGFVPGEGADARFQAESAWYDDKDVGVDRNVTIQGVLIGTGMANYTPSPRMSGTGTISKRPLGITFTAAPIKKTYDGTTSAIAALRQGEHYTLTNVVAGEEGLLTLSGTGVFSDKNAGKGKTVNFTGLTLAGMGAGNYAMPTAAHTGTGEIAPKELTLAKHGAPYFAKVYDGNTNVTEAMQRDTNYKIDGVVAGEDATVVTLDEAAARGAYATKNAQAAGDGQDVTFSSLRLTGTGAGNYTIAASHTFRDGGKITPKTLTAALSGGARFDKTYDGTRDVRALANADYTLAGVVAGEEGMLALKGTGQYSDKNAGTGKAVTFAGLTLDGEGAANYVLSATTLSATGDIAKRALTMEKTAGTHFTKVYDGNKNVTQTLQRGVNYTLTGAVEGEDDTVVSIDTTSAHGAYQTKDAQEGDAMQDVDFTGITLTGTGAGNYTLAPTMTIAGAGKITPKELNVDLASGVHFDKTYDGDANVTQTLSKGTNYTLTNFVAGEGAGITLDETVRGRYADKNAGADKAVTFDGLTLTGTGAGNYKLNRTNLTSTGTIAQRTLGVTFTTAPVTKVYDGTTNAIAALSKGEHYTLTNFAAGEGDGITITGTGTFADKNVGTKAANFSALTLTGEGAGNYQLATTTHTGTGEITPRDLTLTADEKSVTQGEALPAFTGTAAGFADGEDESVFGTERLAFTSTVADTNTPGSYAVTGRIGSVAEGLLGNYRIRQAPGNARAFTVTAMPVSGGILASLVQDAKPVFDDGYSRIVYLFGTPRPVRALTLGLYRFDAEDGLEIQGLNL